MNYTRCLNMSEATSLPIYTQISEMLMREIIAGRLLDGERLLPERNLAKSLNISVGTLRKALKDLEQKGALFRKHGSGNYVKFNTKFDSIYSFFRVELIDGGGLPSAKNLDINLVQKPKLHRFLENQISACGLDDYVSSTTNPAYWKKYT